MTKTTSCVLTSGIREDDNQPFPDEALDIEPTMTAITRNGRRFFRMNKARQQRDDGTWAAVYLWDGFGDEMMKRAGIRTRSAVD